eukprot:CAMPEP_0178404108 /NCGR_PEP_ID=MMETSP0689_2-20121128/17710_1 /TAXON_ID=160604 /ORGANISM="Amphidinium massartii, Strain CS-259" /LENGTH=66 /DNA_ID=CAMNT_0020025075 /DNA_START=184 /DNA_END=385 /DNA_ORIENTATION=+
MAMARQAHDLAQIILPEVARTKYTYLLHIGKVEPAQRISDAEQHAASSSQKRRKLRTLQCHVSLGS